VSSEPTPSKAKVHASDGSSSDDGRTVNDRLSKGVAILPDEIRTIDQLMGGEIAKLFEDE
jgi:hypothetical protein